MKRCILNVACGGAYPLGQDRLVRSLIRVGDPTDRMMWRDQWPGAPHADAQGGFKIDAFDLAYEAGYRQIVWLDAQVIARRSLDRIWQWLERRPVLQVQDGWWLGQWTSDAALEIFGITRDKAMEIPMSWTKVVGIDLDRKAGVAFLDRWRDLRDRGAFAGPWHADHIPVSSDPRCKGHRHDQSCASFLAWEMKEPMAQMKPFISSQMADDTVLTALPLP